MFQVMLSEGARNQILKLLIEADKRQSEDPTADSSDVFWTKVAQLELADLEPFIDHPDNMTFTEVAADWQRVA